MARTERRGRQCFRRDYKGKDAANNCTCQHQAQSNLLQAAQASRFCPSITLYAILFLAPLSFSSRAHAIYLSLSRCAKFWIICRNGFAIAIRFVPALAPLICPVHALTRVRYSLGEKRGSVMSSGRSVILPGISVRPCTSTLIERIRMEPVVGVVEQWAIHA